MHGTNNGRQLKQHGNPSAVRRFPGTSKRNWKAKLIGQLDAIAKIDAGSFRRTGRDWLPKDAPPVCFCCWASLVPARAKTVEALADVLHGSEKTMLKVDCGEF